MRLLSEPARRCAVLVTGPVRSGKSRFAVGLAKDSGRRVIFVATCQPRDAEMRTRVRRHRCRRPRTWPTCEEPLRLPERIRQARKGELLLVDCLTLWISNLLEADGSERAARRQIRRLCEAVRSTPASVILVSNEVGWGIVPEYASARLFRDLVGSAHQQLARCCSDVFLVVCGLPQALKKGVG
ncbi:MAG: bifunctional adenosylcobinamide kinase/adenosylcobinamide-phosphate guanylyltransferase [Candidatus Omnitrophica bacterium]|nr:bifunctional adenosylcobinamide kinase/adenosylcobinamide-phosphate guanylyltransferase [Candidatus Omnitrophota bacterium]